MELKELSNSIEKAYDELIMATHKYRDLALLVNKKQNEIDVEKAKLLESGVINGKNAEIREAQVRLELYEQFEQIELIRVHEDGARMNMEFARLEVEKLRALLRVEEVIAGQIIGFEG
jgi:hypothetical protein